MKEAIEELTREQNRARAEKQMREKSNQTGEQVALSGVYQAKLELIDKLFGTELFEERSEK